MVKGVSAFGIFGTNAKGVFEELPQTNATHKPATVTWRTFYLSTFSAHRIYLSLLNLIPANSILKSLEEMFERHFKIL